MKLSDRTIAHLRDIAEQPDLSGSRYAIVREIARGGMGVVYEAEDRELGRNVALKVLALDISGPAMAERMRVEAQTIARLEHPGIVPVHDVGILPDGRAWYAMKLVRGETMTKGSLRVFLQICETVAFAHAHGVVHGDLKPDNVMLGPFGEVLVMDWGGAGLGTRGYMAPEQEAGHEIDARADVYSLGRILGQQPMTRPLAAIVRKAVEAERDARYRDAAALADDVRRYMDGDAVSVYEATLLERAGRWIRRNRVLLGLIAAYIIMRVVIFLTMRR